MNAWQRRTTDGLYVLVEAIAWAMVLRVLATSFEREFLGNLASQLQFLARSEGFENPEAAAQLAAQVAQAAEGATAGPSVLLVALAAFGGFYVTRALVRSRITGSLGALVALIASVFGLNLLLHVALSGDVRIWDSSGVATFIDNSGVGFSGALGAIEFLRAPDLGRPHGAAMALSFMGMVAVWGRFMIAGRKAVSFDRVLRSFTFGFIAVVIAVIGATIEGATSIAALGVPYFVLAILLLAIANAARGTMRTEDVTKRAPWITSVLVTVGALAAIGALVGLLAFVQIDRPLVYVLGIVGNVVGVILVIIITPISWIVVGILSWLLPEGLGAVFDNLPAAFILEPAVIEQAEEENQGLGIPGWIPDALRVFALSLFMYFAYRMIRSILNRRTGGPEDEYEEARGSAGEGAGLGNLLRGLFSRGRPAVTTGNWMRRHRVYRLYGRTVVDAEERGFRRRPGETPIEFSAVAGRVLDAALFNEIATEFDRARYGRHYPDDEWTVPMEQQLVEWETEHPVTEELRSSVAGAQPMTEAEQFAVRVAAGRQRVRESRSGGSDISRPSGF